MGRKLNSRMNSEADTMSKKSARSLSVSSARSFKRKSNLNSGRPSQPKLKSRAIKQKRFNAYFEEMTSGSMDNGPNNKYLKNVLNIPTYMHDRTGLTNQVQGPPDGNSFVI